jgi:hypothetical protein
MPIPTRQDQDLADIDDTHGVIMVRLRTWSHAGPRRDPASIRAALQQYVDQVAAFTNADQ